MAQPLSPTVRVREIDLTGYIPSVSTEQAGFAGYFMWGPAFERRLVTNESDLIALFRYPVMENQEDWWVAWSYLAYSNKLWLVRVVNHTSNNTLLTGTITMTAPSRNVVGVGTKFDIEIDVGDLMNIGTDSYKVDTITDNTHCSLTSVALHSWAANTISKPLNGSVSTITSSNAVVGFNTTFTTQVAQSDIIVINAVAYTVNVVSNNTSLSLATNAASTLSKVAAKMTMTGTVTTEGGSANVVGISTIFSQELVVGDFISAGDDDNLYEVESIANDDHMSLVTIPILGASANNVYKANDYRAKNASAANNVGVYVPNDTAYTYSYADGSLDSIYGSGAWIAKYPGKIGNAIKISVCASPQAYQSDLSGTITINAGSASVTGAGTAFNSELVVGDLLIVNKETHKIAAISSDTLLTLTTHHIRGATANVAIRRWEYYMEVTSQPDVTTYANLRGAANDELHMVVVDRNGFWTGQAGEVLEKFQGLSSAFDAKFENGTSAYYFNAIDNRSRYIRWAAHDGQLANAGMSITGANTKVFGGPILPMTYTLRGGKDGSVPGNAQKLEGFDLFRSPEEADVTYIIGGQADTTVATYLVNNICEPRMDCVAFLSVPSSTVVDNYLNETDDVVEFRSYLPSSSYYFLTSNWKLHYDKYRDLYIWIPDCGDIAGLAAKTAIEYDPWWSFAGLNRGHLKNVVKLAWNPNEAQRDILYINNINPVFHKRNEGPVLWGDKTGLYKPSAFDRINVRMLFIVLEKAIKRASEYTLFEFNDIFTQNAFKNMVEPYLRQVKGRRGIYDFKVVCDGTVNTPEVIDNNEFIANIFIKPARVIDWITLNFIAVRTGIDFNIYIGQQF